MRAKFDFVPFNTIKRYARDAAKMKIGQSTTRNLQSRINKLIKETIDEAKKFAKKDKRKTILPRDMKPAVEKIILKTNLDYKDLIKEIKKLSAVELGNLARGVDGLIEAEKKKAGRK